ncbi:hypothetical protein Goari_000445 [Gossypium aridum]|uniref:RNase H type-1 domain-containing protein n=1 Tax=Gossypium aridum TaxID=34290 RepID=A0A7J8YHH8_GOSAI|nr:hypothetical protein [Gossypium aridum]
MGIPPPQSKVGPNRITWAGSSNGSFSIKSSFWKIQEETWNPKNDIWQLPWKFQGPQRDWISANLQNHLNLHLDGIYWQCLFVLDSELWGILEGLTIAMDKGFDRVLIDSDSHEAVQAIQKSTTNVSNSNLIRRINLRVVKLSQWSIQHISRDFNKETDSLS